MVGHFCGEKSYGVFKREGTCYRWYHHKYVCIIGRGASFDFQGGMKIGVG